MNIPLPIKKAIVILESNNYEVYIVGGAVRDFLLGDEPEDFDLTTNALADQVKKIFSKYRVIETGLKHGTVTVIIDDYKIEVTTYRSEEGYFDNRHPSKITFVSSLKEDLSRRDFTINALAYNKKLIDYFDGISDLNKKIIKTVGPSDKRFKEDALRILRAIRFASVLGFEIEEETKKSIFRNKDLLKNISYERIQSELNKIICGKNVYNCLLEYKEIISVFIPEIKENISIDEENKNTIDNLYKNTLDVVKNVKPTPILRFAAFFHNIGIITSSSIDEENRGFFTPRDNNNYEIIEIILRRLKFSNKEISKILVIIKNQLITLDKNKNQIIKYIRNYSLEIFLDLLELKKAIYISNNQDLSIFSDIYNIIEEIKNENIIFSLKDLKINGHDLLANGFDKGPIISIILNKILEEVSNGNLINKKEVLIKYAINYKNKYF